MSSGSSENDVQDSVMSDTSDNEELQNAVLSILSHCQQDSVVSDTSDNEELQNAVLSILSHGQVIYDAIRKLEKKLDTMHGKVSKIHRFGMKTVWQNRKHFGCTYRKYNYLLSRKIRFQKRKKKGSPATFSYPESYSPTSPVRRQENESDIQTNPIDTSFHSDVPCEPEQLVYGEEEEEPVLEESWQVPANFEDSFQPCFSPEEPLTGPSTTPCFSSPRAPSTSSVFSARASITVVSPGEGSPSSNPDVGNYGSLEKKSIGQQTDLSSVGGPPRFGH